MSHYLIFALGVVCGVPLGIWIIALCQTARDNYYYPEELPVEKEPIHEKRTAEYLMEGN